MSESQNDALNGAQNADTNNTNANSEISNDSPKLSLELAAAQVAKQTLNDFDSWSQWRYQESYRKHLGVSLIGGDCMRLIQYVFRWAAKENFDGQKYRLFNRGHREEPMVFEMLRGTGWQVYDKDPSTEKQYRMRGVAGHYGGSVDAVAIPPERFGIGNVPILVSVKTSKAGSIFNKMRDEPINVSAPNYWAQENGYGYGFGINWAMWIIVNKNDDEIAVKIQKLDPNYGRQLEQKAERIVFADKPLERISKSPAMSTCTNCFFKEHCHKGKQTDKNCRSCSQSVPMNEPASNGSGQWFCTNPKYNAIIPEHIIMNGCDDWSPFFAE